MDPVTLALAYVPVQYAPYALAVVGVCALIDAVVPQPVAGSVWVVPRKLISTIGGAFLNAVNRIKPGSDAALIASTVGRSAVVDPPVHDALAVATLNATQPVKAS